MAHDAFRISYDRREVTLDEIFERIRGLGYKPSRMANASRLDEAGPGTSRGPLPGVIAELLADSADTRPLFLDFHAVWCAPCRVLERTVLSRDNVRRVLRRYRVVKIDTDKHPEIARYFDVVGLPTLVVLTASREERFRHMGLIQPDTLIARLGKAAVTRER